MKYIVEPLEAKGELKHVTVIVRPFEDEVPTKNRSFNHGIPLDDQTLPQVGKLVLLLKREKIKRLRAGGMSLEEALNQPLWDFKHKEVLLTFQQAGEALGIKEMTRSVYPLRHGGASRDALSGRRSLEQIRRRGNWAVMSSVQKYERSGRVTLLTKKLGRFNHLQGRKFLQEGSREMENALMKG